MSLFFVVIGTIFQLLLATAFAMFGVFGVNALRESLFFLGIIALPFSCFISAGIIIYNYNIDGSSIVYWWYIMPVILGALYYALICYLDKKGKLKSNKTY